LVAGSGVTIITDHHELVAALLQQAHAEKAEGVEGSAEAAATPPAPLRSSSGENPQTS